MKIYGFEEGVDGRSLALSQVDLAVMADELRCLAQFFQETAETMEQWGDGFDHEHFRDYCKRNGITSIEGTADVIVGRPLSTSPKGKVSAFRRPAEWDDRPLITASEFLTQWGTNDDSSALVRYPADVVAAYGVSDDDQRFFADVGLPAFASPYMHFFFNGGSHLPPPVDPDDRPLPRAPAGLGMIGSCEEGWPICLDANRPGQVLCLRLEPTLQLQMLNSSGFQLAASLLAYRETIDAALAFGIERGIDDAWRTRQYPAELDDELRSCMTAIDPSALAAHGYWAWHFRERESA